MCCVWLFGTVVPRALFWKGSVRSFFRLVFYARFWMCFVGRLVTLVPCAVFLCVLCLNVWYVSSFRTVFILFCKICSYVSALRTVFNVFFLWFFGTLVHRVLFWMGFVRLVVRLASWALFCTCCLWFFRTLVPCALFWTCSVRFLVTLVYCRPFWMCCVGLFGRLVPRALCWKSSVRVLVTLVFCALFWICCVCFLSS